MWIAASPQIGSAADEEERANLFVTIWTAEFPHLSIREERLTLNHIFPIGLFKELFVFRNEERDVLSMVFMCKFMDISEKTLRILWRFALLRFEVLSETLSRDDLQARPAWAHPVQAHAPPANI